jgi:uncharacterized protein (DUF952 family)
MNSSAREVYKIVPKSLWQNAKENGVFAGASIDLEDGFIHFSTREQLRETADKHFHGQSDLMLIAVDAAALGSQLIYEVSRGGALFPHLYAPLEFNAVLSEQELPLDDTGRHIFPESVK